VKLNRNQIYISKNDPTKRLVFWYQSYPRDSERLVLFFVRAPDTGEPVGKVLKQFTIPDQARVVSFEVDPKEDLTALFEPVDQLPHENVKLIPSPPIAFG
jgi:hypothetical protein